MRPSTYCFHKPSVSEPEVRQSTPVNNLVPFFPSFLPPSSYFLLAVPSPFSLTMPSSGSSPLPIILSVGGTAAWLEGAVRLLLSKTLCQRLQTPSPPPAQTYQLQSSTLAASAQVQPDGKTQCWDTELILNSELKKPLKNLSKEAIISKQDLSTANM